MMAKSGKIQDAATAALSAIEEALDLGAPPAPTEPGSEPADNNDKAETSVARGNRGTQIR